MTAFLFGLPSTSVRLSCFLSKDNIATPLFYCFSDIFADTLAVIEQYSAPARLVLTVERCYSANRSHDVLAKHG